MENHIRGLSSRSVPKESYGTLLVPIIFGKLAVETQRNLACEHSNLEWTIDEVQTAVMKEIRILESGLYTTDPSSYTSAPRTPPLLQPFIQASGEDATQLPMVRKNLCVFTVKVSILPMYALW